VSRKGNVSANEPDYASCRANDRVQFRSLVGHGSRGVQVTGVTLPSRLVRPAVLLKTFPC
jgi:hypothetical protein